MKLKNLCVSKSKFFYIYIKNINEFLIALLLIPFILGLVLIVSFIHVIIYRSNPIFLSERVGLKNEKFVIFKLRTMKDNAPIMATGDLGDAKLYITGLGRFLRKYSLDELPQFLNVLKGEMSIVGPRPSLGSQVELNQYREKYGVSELRPGITGLAQIIYRDHASDKLKARVDRIYFKKISLCLDIWIMLLTVKHVAFPRNVRH